MTAAATEGHGSPSDQRSFLLDALRGFALLGILLVNMSYFAGWWDSPRELQESHWGSSFDIPAAFAIEWLAAEKFYSLFSLMFGVGFALQLQRLETAGGSLRPYVRRMIALLMFGVLHMLLLWMGDILALYAIMGLSLLLFRGVSDEALVCAAAALFLMPIGWAALIAGGFDPTAPFAAAGQSMFHRMGLSPSSLLEMWASADYTVHLKGHVGELFFNYSNLIYELRPAKILAMFLIGYWIGRRTTAGEPALSNRSLRRIAAGGLVVGLPFCAVAAWLSIKQFQGLTAMEQFVSSVASAVGVPPLAFAHAALFTLVWRAGGGRFLKLAAPAGQMALTNYLLQSLVQCVIFFGWGFGLVGRVPLIVVLPASIGVFLIQIAGSAWWLRHFRFGPVEWLWRMLTYARPLRLKR